MPSANGPMIKPDMTKEEFLKLPPEQQIMI